MKRMKRIGAMLLTMTMAVGMLQTGVLAADVSQAAIQAETQTFTGFTQAGTQIGQVSFVLGQSEAELTAQMPQTLTVALTDGTTAEIPVTWVCLGDYANTDDYYYEFIPQWDLATYTPAYTLDSATDVPYVIAQRSDGTSETAEQNYGALKANAYTVFNFLIEECGYNAAAACGVLANIEAESNFNPNVWGDSGNSYGICQWYKTRRLAMENFCATDPVCVANGYTHETLMGQLYYLKKELSANNSAYLWNGKKINDYMLSVSNTAQGSYEAGYYWCYYFEVPADKTTRSISRGNTAKNKYWPELSSTVTDTPDKTESDGAVYNIFSDINQGDWYCEAIQYMYDKGLMSGVTETTFCPKDSLNRAMAAVILYSLSQKDSAFALNSSNTANFTDVWNGAWFQNGVKWAAGAGLVSGYNENEFKPTKNITREQFVAILYNYAKKLGWNVSSSASLNSFSDASSVTAYAVPAMQWAVSKGVICGSNGALNPKSSLTRAEAAVIIKSFVALA